MASKKRGVTCRGQLLEQCLRPKHLRRDLRFDRFRLPLCFDRFGIGFSRVCCLDPIQKSEPDDQRDCTVVSFEFFVELVVIVEPA